MLYNYLNITKPLEFNSIGKCENHTPDYIHRKNQLETFELIVVTEGTLYLKVGNTKYSVTPGQYLLLQPDDNNPKAACNMLTGWKASSCEFYWMHFSCRNHSFISELWPNDFISTDHSVYLPIHSNLIAPEKVLLLMRMLQDHRCSKLISLLDYGNYLTSLIILEVYQQFRQIMQYGSICIEQRKLEKSSRQPSSLLYNDMTDYIRLHIRRNIKMHELSNYFGYSAKHLSLICKENSGLSLKQYMLKLKIDQASFQLLDTNLSIQEISASLGFSDSHNFSRTFKNIMGMTPSEYRNSYDRRIINK